MVSLEAVQSLLVAGLDQFPWTQMGGGGEADAKALQYAVAKSH